MGRKYAECLSEWIHQQKEVKEEGINVWCSTLKRTIETAGILKDKAVIWRDLREIEVGICDGMTYEEVEKIYPEEFAARKKDKLRYRYPRGESYMDVIARLEPVIFELERMKGPLLVIAHRAVLRCLFAYFLDEPYEKIPYLTVPLHTVIRMQPKTYGYDIKHFPLGEEVAEREDGRHRATTTTTTTTTTKTSTPTPTTTTVSPPILPAEMSRITRMESKNDTPMAKQARRKKQKRDENGTTGLFRR